MFSVEPGERRAQQGHDHPVELYIDPGFDRDGKHFGERGENHHSGQEF
jgi:hypothetical protein